jgi:DNA-directed RNA polymerase subunit H
VRANCGGFELAKFDFSGHFLVPKHEILSKDEEDTLLKTYSIKKEDLPIIKMVDPALSNLKATPGSIVRIERNSQTGGKVYYYRLIE